ncbi:alpha/beta hydrolase [Caballeronia sp. LZ043]|uniref:alpha/beta fold hydrolase n=1 Tax=Caballeronia sp. LZ043 TaxID=3038569 RepID=UPI00285F417C|nr:alpha/beta hydrolase [Caballeronia sp. LZ043]MDR5821724.1 alpha/beta hydrolase [Caballeronia sp. LZ043]
MNDIHQPAYSAAAPLEARSARFPARIADAGGVIVAYREATAAHATHALPLVLLHGLGSGAGSWVQQLEALGGTRRVLAWDAPGYGVSTPVAPASPRPEDYARVLAGWLDALGVSRCVLVGHSLGAIVAGAFAVAHPARLGGLLLVSPAGGYGAATQALRDEKRDARLAMLAELGPAGLAQRRSPNMLSASADEAARAWVRWNMSCVIPQGYAQATHLLAHADLAADLAHYRGVVSVAVGAEDTITSPAACERIAKAARTPLQIVPHAGHAGYIEAPRAYNALIAAFARACDANRSH